jgi:hypothetical protein
MLQYEAEIRAELMADDRAGGKHGWFTEVSETVCFSHLYVKTNILPRQARDKHRKTGDRFRADG